MFSFQSQEYTLNQEDQRPARGFTNSFGAIDESDEVNRFDQGFQQLHLHKVASGDTTTSDTTLLEPPMLHIKNDSCHSISSVDTMCSLKLRRFNSASSISSSQQSLSISPLSLPQSSLGFKKVAKFPVQQGVQLIDNIHAFQMLGIDNCFVIDVRPFTEFNSGHLTNAINFNIPSTLLKRPNFTLQRCLNNISLVENVKLSNFLLRDNDDKKILLYDQWEVLSDEVPLTLFGTLNKFINEESCHAELFVLKSGYLSFKSEYPEVVESNPAPQQSQILKPPPHNRSLSLANLSSSTPISPNLSRFHLPKLPQTPVFKIRHNEEFYDFDNYKVLHEFKFLTLALSNNMSPGCPRWLSGLFANNSCLSLIEKFKSLEIEERTRINDMISTNSVGSGIELGFKNRYKDIFPYEHTRVKLATTPTYEHHGYINANFISAPHLSKMKYIASQAPLESTARDFAKLCKDNNIEVIVALTSQFENGVEKCYPYWKDSNFELLETFKMNKIIIRRLKLTSYNREVLQIQILNWTDYDVMINSQQDDLLKLVYLKYIVLKRLAKMDENVIVHCSAGCGRTGTFCTLDSIFNEDLEAKKSSIEGYPQFDPIFEIVKSFRNQRISMVQNLRQYLFIYDCLLNFYDNFKDFKNYSFQKLDGLDILAHFYENKAQEV
jgi:protein-tyrosine phosphatase